MKVTEHIERADSTLFSFEILPPLKGKSIESIYNGIDPLMDLNPAFIDVTYHREEYILRERKEGGYDRIATKKRPGTVAICAAIMNKYKIDAIPHIICGGFNKEETENALIDLSFLGIDNILALRGDNQKSENTFVPEPGGNRNALELIFQVANMNKGIYMDEELTNANPTDFCIGVAGYPEKHQDAPNLQSDLNFLKRKLDAGAEYVVTQMFFDNQKYFEFVDACRAMDINIPIIPGLKPISRKTHLSTLPKIFHMDIPFELSAEIEKAKDNKAIEQIGIEWCIQQSKELKQAGAPALHYYTMGKSAATREIVSKVF